MNHSFNIEVAQKYGIEEAILLENLFWWCEKNRANGKHIVNGRAWTYNSAKAYAELFPYMSPAKIRRVLISMEEQGLIYSDCFNENKYDQTKWYTLTDLATAFYKNVKSSEQKCEIKTDIKPNIKPVKQNITPSLEEIEQFCKERGNGVDAKKVFDYYSSANWKDGRGNPVKNWKQKIIAVWEKDTTSKKGVGQVAHKAEDYREGFDEHGNFRW